jgi:spore coat protein A
VENPSLVLTAALAFLLVSSAFVLPVCSQSTELLDPLTIPKWVNQLTGPLPVYIPVNITDNSGNVVRQDFVVNASEFYQQILPTTDANGNPTGFGPTKVWGYGGLTEDPTTGEYLGFVTNTPGPSFEAIRNLPIRVKWVNNLVDTSGNSLSAMFAVDPTIHWANPRTMTMPTPPVKAPTFPPGYADAQTPVPIVTHLHGGEVPPAYDGGPDAWFTANGIQGPSYNTAVTTDPNAAVYEYPNTQEPTTLWYHDHALGITRLNIMSGLAGFYILRGPSDPIADLLPKGKYDAPLCIQDRSFLTDGSLYYPSKGDYPEIHPYWRSSFLGNTIMVNGKVWPNMNVQQGLYRFRILDGSNSRFYQLSFSNNMPFVQIGSDGGYLKTEAPLTSLLISPAERADILVDFSNVTPGTKIILKNNALTSNSEAEKQSVGQVMQFTVTDSKGFVPKTLPTELNPTLAGSFPTLQNVTKQRILTLAEASGPNGPLALYLDGQKWSAPISENPELGTTEEWVIVNPTDSEHPIHLHLVQFQIVGRQTFNDTAYLTDWTSLNGPPPLNHSTMNLPSLTPYLTGPLVTPDPNEQGWKDTAIMYTGQVTIIRVRFAQQDGSAFTFDATSSPGYVWHCHLLEHEDNEMMRPYVLTKKTSSPLGLPLETILIITAIIAVIVIALAIVVRKHFHA